MAKRVQQKPRRRVGLKEMGRRGLSMLMAMIMVISLIQISAFAVDENRPAELGRQGQQVTSEDGLVTVEKTAKHTGGNNFDITLTVTTKDQVTTTPAQDTHAVLVIDRSNSMEGSRIKSARDAAKTFAGIVLGKEAAGNNQIAVVSYSWNYEDRIGLSGDLDAVTKAINKVTTNGNEENGGTNIQAGIHRAQEILAADTSDAKKVILVLSDGEPTYSYQAIGESGWEGCSKGPLGVHHWNQYVGGDYVNPHFTGFNYSKVVGSGSGYSLWDSGRLYGECAAHHKTWDESWGFFSNNGQPAIKEAEFAKNAGTEIYSVFLGKSSESNAVNTMKGVASGEDHYKLASDVDELAEIFKGIAGSITTPTNAGTVTDPMGQFIVLGDVSDLAAQGVTKTGDGLTWNVSQATPTENADGSKTYTITYPITLNTSAEGFTDGQEYATNGTTTFQYQFGGENRSVKFDVPTVKGYAPMVDYTINYWYKDKKSGQYQLGKTAPGSGRIWSEITISSSDYSKENYEFKKGPTGTQILSEDNMVFDLYYDPIAANVTVKHYVSTITDTDDGFVYSEPVLEDWQKYSKYQGDEFTNEEFLDSETYTKVDSVTVGDTTYTTSDYTNITLRGDTTINIYYTREGENQRTPVDYVIQYWYRNNAWELVDGKYQVVEGEYFKGHVDYGTAKHGETIEFADKNDGYTLDQIEGSNGENSFQLTLNKAEPNPDVVNVYYSKDPVTAPEEATLTIVHKFYKLGINGPELVDTQYEMGSEDGGDEVYVGETYTAEDRTPSGFIRMTSDAGMTKEMVSGHNKIVVEYYRDTLEETHVSVYHYYRTWAWEVNAETGDGEYVLVKEDMKPGHPEGTFYVGQTYQAVPNPNGFELNEEESDLEARVLVQGDNTFQLYYDAYESKEEDEADVTVHHIYETYRSYVDADGNVVLDELDEDATIIKSEETYYGVKGDTFVAQLQEKEEEGYEFYKADTSDLKVTLQGEDGDYYIYYKKTVNDLGEKVPVTVQPVYKTYTRYINDNGEDVTEWKSTENGTAVELGQYYVGQNATALSSDYAKPGFTYDAADADNTQNLTVNVTGEGDVITVVYSRVEDNRGAPVVLLVNNVYTTRTTYIENGEVKTSETSFTGSNTTYPIYLNQFANVANLGTKLPGYELDSTKTQPSDWVQITEDGMQFTFYWVMEVDRTTPATVKVVHHYKIHDANPNVSDRIWTVGENDAPVAAYAFQDYLLPYAYDGQFKPSDVKDVQHNGVSISERNAVELTAGDNRIDIYYEKNEDSRVPSSVKVVHNYYKDADALVAGTTEASYEENISKIGENLVMEADTFTATLRLENGSMTYNFDSATPADYTITVNADAEKNVITINYVRAETTYTVVHEYYTNGEFTGKTEQHLGGKAGDVINAADITKVTSYGGETYTYSGASADSITLAADGSSTITLQYDRTTGGGGGGGTTYYNLVVKYLEEGTDEELAPSYTARIAAGRSYDVTAQTEKVIDGYEISQVTGDDVTGYMNGNREIIVYYTVDIDDGETPLDPGPGGDGDGTDIDDGEVPLDPGPGGDGDGTDIGDENVPLVPATGDNLALWVMAAVASAAGLVYLTVAGKKREKDNT